MGRERRWDPCVSHRGAEIDGFIVEYFGGAGRNVLLIAGAGFDPRSTAVAERLKAAGASVRAILFQENRPKPAQDLVNRATSNAGSLTTAVANHVVIPVEIFGTDGAVVGGRNIAVKRIEDLTPLAK